jgi:hypothetical protein
MLKKLCTVILLCGVASGCTQAPAGGTGPGANPPGSDIVAGTKEGDWAAIVKLEDEAKAIAKVTGCTSNDCRAAAVGSRACGGPRYYIPYCAKTTDSVALFSKLSEIAKAEQAYNKKYQIVSTCEFRMPPTVEAVAGSCVAK